MLNCFCGICLWFGCSCKILAIFRLCALLPWWCRLHKSRQYCIKKINKKNLRFVCETSSRLLDKGNVKEVTPTSLSGKAIGPASPPVENTLTMMFMLVLQVYECVLWDSLYSPHKTFVNLASLWQQCIYQWWHPPPHSHLQCGDCHLTEGLICPGRQIFVHKPWGWHLEHMQEIDNP